MISPAAAGHLESLQKELETIYCSHCNERFLNANDNNNNNDELNDTFHDLKRHLNSYLEKVFKKSINVDIPTVKITANAFMKAVDKSLANLKTDYARQDNIAFYRAIEQNCFRFAAAKNYHETLALSKLLIDDNGNARSFDEFKKLATSILETFRNDWLRTEYDQALITGHRIADYRRQVANGDTFPTWQYKTRDDGHVRPGHLMLHNMKLAANDPAWRFIYPPNGWRCRCYIKPLSEAPPNLSNGDKAIDLLRSTADTKGRSEWDNMVKQGFASNPALDGVIFPLQHPYWKEAPDDILRKASLLAPNNFNRIYTSSKNTGWVDVHQSHGKQELKANLAIARILADEYGEQIRLMPIDNTPGVKNPDAMIITKNNELWDFKTPVTPDIRHQIFNSIKQAKRQKLENILIRISGNKPVEIIKGFLDIGIQRFGTIRKIQLLYQHKLISVDLSLLKEKKLNELLQFLKDAL